MLKPVIRILVLLQFSQLVRGRTEHDIFSMFDLEDITDLNGTDCLDKWSCKKPNIEDRNCHCDSDCATYKDCCSDVAETQNIKSFIPTFSCEYVPKINADSYVFVVKTCPAGTRQDLRRACEHQEGLQIPVSGLYSGYTYSNMYCAACHNEEFLHWQAGYFCSANHKLDLENSVINNTKCKQILQPPNYIVTSKIHSFEARRCFPIVDTCSLENHESDGCTNSETRLVFDEHVYKNPDCAVCNNVSLENLVCSANAWKLRPSGDTRHGSYSYRLLFDFRSGEATGVSGKYSRTQKSEKVNKRCNELEMYDVYSDTCRKVNCIRPLVYEDGKCVYKPLDMAGKTQGITPPRRNTTSCVYIRLNDTEYKIVSDHVIFIYSINKTLTNDSYFVDGDKTFVCQDTFRNDETTDFLIQAYRQSESVLSLVGSILSITALTVTLCLYLRFPKLQNTPGKSLMCLMLSLIVAQLLFLLAYLVEDHSHVCIGFAVTIHFSFLASVFWMNCMSFDIFLTFSKGFVKSDAEKSNRRFLWYSLYAWILPLLIVVSGIVLDILSLDAYRPKYGHIVCWIGNEMALLVYFLLPIGILVLSNILFYIFTVRSIYKSNRQAIKILRRKKTCKILVYVKLSIVMGLTWVFAYVASFTNEMVFWYLFIFFSSWQGVFIFISFVCFGKVRSLVVDRARYMSTYIRTRTTTTSMLTDSKS